MKLLLSFSIISLSWSLVGAERKSAGCGKANKFEIGACKVEYVKSGPEETERFAEVCTPTSGAFTDDALPLVFSFHGNPSTAHDQKIYTEMHETGEEFGFYVVYPQGLQYGMVQTSAGLEKNYAHNAGTCCGKATADDLQFTRDLLEDIGNKACIDLDKVFVTGWSNGGYMAYYLACKASDIISAVAPVGGLIGLNPWTECDTEVPVLHFHEINDPEVDYCGKVTPTGEEEWASAELMVTTFAEKQGCSAEVGVSYYEEAVTCLSHKDCPSGKSATLCAVDKATHTWFKGWTGMSKEEGNKRIWKFFDAVTSGSSQLPEISPCYGELCKTKCPNDRDPASESKNVLAKHHARAHSPREVPEPAVIEEKHYDDNHASGRQDHHHQRTGRTHYHQTEGNNN